VSGGPGRVSGGPGRVSGGPGGSIMITSPFGVFYEHSSVSV